MWAAQSPGLAPSGEGLGLRSRYVLSPRARPSHGWRVYLLGGRPGIADKAKEILERDYPGLQIVGTSSPVVDLSKDVSEQQDVLDVDSRGQARPSLSRSGVAEAGGLGAPHPRGSVGSAVMVGIGATLDFVTGAAKRSPPWMSAVGLEWLYRLAHEPGRLWRRYLLRDPRFLAVLVRDARARGKT